MKKLLLILLSSVSSIIADDARKEFTQNNKKSAYYFAGGMYLEGASPSFYGCFKDDIFNLKKKYGINSLRIASYVKGSTRLASVVLFMAAAYHFGCSYTLLKQHQQRQDA